MSIERLVNVKTVRQPKSRTCVQRCEQKARTHSGEARARLCDVIWTTGGIAVDSWANLHVVDHRQAFELQRMKRCEQLEKACRASCLSAEVLMCSPLTTL